MEEKFWPLPIEDLFFVGKSTALRLRSLGITTIGQLAKSDHAMILSVFKSGIMPTESNPHRCPTTTPQARDSAIPSRSSTM